MALLAIDTTHIALSPSGFSRALSSRPGPIGSNVMKLSVDRRSDVLMIFRGPLQISTAKMQTTTTRLHAAKTTESFEDRHGQL